MVVRNPNSVRRDRGPASGVAQLSLAPHIRPSASGKLEMMVWSAIGIWKDRRIVRRNHRAWARLPFTPRSLAASLGVGAAWPITDSPPIRANGGSHHGALASSLSSDSLTLARNGQSTEYRVPISKRGRGHYAIDYLPRILASGYLGTGLCYLATLRFAK